MLDRILIADREEVIIGRGLPAPLLPPSPREQALILTQRGARVVADAVAGVLRDTCPVEVMEVPDGEAAKDLAVVETVYRRLADRGIGRHDTLVGVGGGTVTDLAGFVAATWMRGIEVVHVPTTLLAAVDAALGGKTGVNFAGKNLVGAFWHPRRVVVDLDVLASLPAELITEGSAEAVKAGLIGDPTLVDLYRREGLGADLGEVVRRAVRVKAKVVGDDFRETGGRAVLNFGHTLGHGLEAHTGLSHGRSVALGMVAAAEISARRHGFDASQVPTVLARLGLPVTAAEAGIAPDVDEVLALVRRDKKRDPRGLRFVTLRAVGEPVVDHVTDGELLVGLAAIGVA